MKRPSIVLLDYTRIVVRYRQLDPPIRITAQIFVPQIRAHDPLFIWAHLAMGRPTLENLLPYFATASCVFRGRAFLVGARPMGGAIPVGHGHGKEEGPLSWACSLGLSRQFRYALSLSVFDYNYTRRVYNRAGPWTFGFGILLSLLSLCLLMTLG